MKWQGNNDKKSRDKENGEGCEVMEGEGVRQQADGWQMENRGRKAAEEVQRWRKERGAADGTCGEENWQGLAVKEEGKGGDGGKEKEGVWDHLRGPEYCPACRQNPFECGCMDVSFANDQEKERHERIDLTRRTTVHRERRRQSRRMMEREKGNEAGAGADTLETKDG